MRAAIATGPPTSNHAYCSNHAQQAWPAAFQVQKKSKGKPGKMSKAGQSPDAGSEAAEDQENMAHNASPPGKPAAEADTTVPALSRCAPAMLCQATARLRI